MAAVPTAVVFVAPGSRAAAANVAHRAQAERLAGATGLPVEPAFLELAEPPVGEGIDRAVAAGARRVLVLPYFLYPGRHLTADIPALVDEARARHPDVELALLGGFGDDAGLVALLAAQVAAAAG